MGVAWDDRSSMRWLEFHEMTRVPWDDKRFMRWQEIHEMTRVASDDKSCIRWQRAASGDKSKSTAKEKETKKK